MAVGLREDIRRVRHRLFGASRPGTSTLAVLIVGTLRAVTEISANVSPSVGGTGMPPVAARAMGVYE